ncbi:MAG: chromate resistance protein ChrB domain-containing protein [Steroidobacteraceae bacterium]
MHDTQAWLLLIINLPGANATPRMRVWRGLKAAGAATLRDGVYVLPQRPDCEAVFEEQAQEVIEAGGAAHVIEFATDETSARTQMRPLFDRSREYADLLAKIDAFKVGMEGGAESAVRRSLAAIRRDIASVVSTDYFGGPAREQAEAALEDAEAAVNARFAPDEPHAAPGRITRRDKTDYCGRTWATRTHLWVDRVASAWLIRRFIDPQGRFVWLQEVAQCPSHAIGFDFDGAEFSHVGARVTFEVLAASFGLEQDPGLARIGAMVHALDVGGVPVPEAAGFAAILAGARAQTRDDDELLAQIGKTLDFLYAAHSAATDR